MTDEIPIRRIQNTLSPISIYLLRFDSIYNIKLRTYFAGRPSELRETALKAIEDGAELLIGGDVAVEAAKEADLPSLFLSSTEDSMRVAFSMAESMDFAMGAQKRSSAQLEALLKLQRESKSTIIIVTHDQRVYDYGDEKIQIVDGCLHR